MEIGDTLSTVSSSAAASDAAVLADNFDTFLTLLTTQLENQDPLSPLDSNQFTQQLVQFSQVEQSIAANQNLEEVLALLSASNAANAVSYLGKQILAEGDAAALSGGTASWRYELAEPASSANLTITDADGKLVYAAEAQTGAGQHDFVWDGTDSEGTALPDGVYHLSVVAHDAEGASIGTTTYSTGIVSGVNNDAEGTELLLGPVAIPLASVVSVQNPEPEA